MSSVPREVLRDVLHPLDRWTLDGVQFTNRRFLQLVLEHMSDVCLRQVTNAGFQAAEDETGRSSYSISIDTSGSRWIRNQREDTARLLSEFVHALRSSRVKYLALIHVVFTPELVALVLQTPIVAGRLVLLDGSCAERTPTQFRGVVQRFSPSKLEIHRCHLRACHVTDEFLRALFKDRTRHVVFPRIEPVDGGKFAATDDAIVDFCMQEDVPIDQEAGESDHGSLILLGLHNASFTKDFFKRLVEASSASTRTQPLRIEVSPWPVEEEDLRDFAQHLSYRERGTAAQLRIYDFPGEQHGTEAAMHLQIVLHPDKTLLVHRAQRTYLFFCEADE